MKLQEVLKVNFRRFQNQTSRGLKTKLLKVPIEMEYADRHGGTDAERDRMMERITATRELIKDNICYSDLTLSHPHERARIDELVEIMVDACTSESRTLRIGKEDRPQVLVQSRFEKYDYSMMEYVLFCLSDNTTKVHNIKNYLLTTLYNAPLTMGNYYSAEVNHDMPQYAG